MFSKYLPKCHFFFKIHTLSPGGVATTLGFERYRQAHWRLRTMSRCCRHPPWRQHPPLFFFSFFFFFFFFFFIFFFFFFLCFLFLLHYFLLIIFMLCFSIIISKWIL